MLCSLVEHMGLMGSADGTSIESGPYHVHTGVLPFGGVRITSTSMTLSDNDSSDIAAAKADPAIGKFITGEPKKVILVPGRLLNVVV